MLTYTDLMEYETYDDRLNYLQVISKPAEQTFGPLRKLNQQFYQSRAWKQVREYVITRDMGYDLGVPGHSIFGRVLVHHMNPINPKDLLYKVEIALEPEFLITVSDPTHLHIHFGSSPHTEHIVERHPGDTKLW